MNKYKKRIKRAAALILATVTTVTSTGLDWGTLRVHADPADYVNLTSTTMKAKFTASDSGSGKDYVKLNSITFDAAVNSTGASTIKYQVDVYDMGDNSTDYPTGRETKLGTFSEERKYVDGVRKSSLREVLDAYYAASADLGDIPNDAGEPVDGEPHEEEPQGDDNNGSGELNNTPDSGNAGETPTPDTGDQKGDDLGDGNNGEEILDGQVGNPDQDPICTHENYTYVSGGYFTHKRVCDDCGLDLDEAFLDCYDAGDIAIVSNDNGTHTIKCNLCGQEETQRCGPVDEKICEICGGRVGKSKGDGMPLADPEYTDITGIVATFDNILVPAGTNIGVIISFNGSINAAAKMGGGSGAMLFVNGEPSGREVRFNADTPGADSPTAKNVIISQPSVSDIYVDVTNSDAVIPLTATATLTNDKAGVISWSGSDVSFSSDKGNSVTATIGKGNPGDYTVTAKAGSNDMSATVTVHAVTATLDSDTFEFDRDSSKQVIKREPTPSITPSTTYTVSYEGSDTTGNAKAIIKVGTDTNALVMERPYTITKKALTEADLVSNLDQPENNFVIDSATKSITAYNGAKYIMGTDFTAKVVSSTVESTGMYFDISVQGINNCTGDFVINHIKGVNTAGAINIKDVVNAEIKNINYIYNYGSPVNARVVFKDKAGKTISFEDNVIITCSNNTTASKNAVCTIEGKAENGYTGTIELTYTIRQLSFSSAGVRVTVDGKDIDTEDPKYRFDGSVINPQIVVKANSNTVTLNSSDYEARIINNDGVGTATIRIEGKGNYTGVKSGFITIVPGLYIDGEITLDNVSAPIGNDHRAETSLTYEYDGASKTPSEQKPSFVSVTVANGDVQLNQGTDYEVKYAEDGDYISVGPKTVTIVGKGIYAGQSATATYEILPYSIATFAPSISKVPVDYTDFTYNGQPQIAPSGNFILQKGGSDGRILTEGTDFTVTQPSDITSAGVKTVTLAGIGNYTGTTSVRYEIKKLDLSTCSISKLATKAYSGVVPYTNFAYTGSAIKPQVTVKNSNDQEFTTGFTFEEVFGNNYKDVGIHNFKIKGDGTNITGTKEGKFEIVAKSFSDLTFKINGQVCTPKGTPNELVTNYLTTYNGRAKTFKDKLSVSDGSVGLVLNKDYSVTECYDVNAGPHNITVNGLGNYAGATVYIDFNISPVDINDVSLIENGYETRSDKKIYPKLLLNYGGLVPYSTLMTENNDYTITSDETAAGLGKIATVNGIGNYTGSRTVTYKAGIDISELDYTDGTSDGIKVVGSGKSVYATTSADTSFGVYYGTDLEPGKGDVSYSIIVKGKEYNSDNFSITFDSAKGDIKNSYDGTNIVKVTVTGKGGELFGSKTLYAKIAPGKFTDSSDSPKVTYKNGSATLILKYNGSEIKNPLTTGDFTYTYGDLQSDDLVFTPAVLGTGATKGTITVKAGDKGNFAGELTIPYEIKVEGSDAFEISGVEKEYNYTGSEIRPIVTVTDKKTNAVLTQGVDYDVNYANNIEISDGSTLASVKVTGHKDSKYEGAELTKTFKIVKIDLNSPDVTIRNLDDCIYTGGKVLPTGFSVYYKDTKLVEGVHYTVEYDTKYTVGEHNLVIKAKADSEYTNQKTFTYKIIGYISNTDLFTVGASSSNLNIGNKVDDAGISVGYADPGETTSISSSYYTIEQKKLDYPGVIYVTVTGKDCLRGTARVPINVKAASTNIEVEKIEPRAYTGEEIKPAVQVVYRYADGSKTKLDASCYTLTYFDNINVGEDALAIVNIKPEYVDGGSIKEEKFTIYYDIAAAIVVPDYKSVDYDGTAKEPGVKLYVDEAKTIQIPEASYSVSWKNNTEAGNAEINVTAASPNAKNTHAPVTFKINGQSIVGATIDPETIRDKTYTGTAIEPPINKVLYNGNELVLNKDYTILYRDNIDVTQGTGKKAKVTILGKGSFTGAKILSFDIEPYNLANLTDSDVDIVDAVYAGDDRIITPEFTVKYNGITLTKDKDFKVELGPSQTVGNTNSITFKGQGNFTGQKTFTFKINPADINGSYMVLGTDKVEYTGAPVEPTVSISTNLSGTTYKLQKGKDYRIDSIKDSNGFIVYSPSNVGEYTVVAVATENGNFTGSVTRSFEITKADLNSKKASDPTQDRYSIKFIDHEDRNYPMDGSSAYEPKLEIRDLTAGTILTEGVDYNLTYLNNTASGSMDDANPPTVIITASNDAACNYKGERIEKFNIGTSIVGVTVETNAPELGYMYDGKPHVPTLETVTYTDGAGVEHVLVRNRDYELVPTDRETTINAGTVPYVIKGIGEYYGTYSTEYKINPKVVNDSNISDIVITLSYPKDSAGYYTIFDSNPPYEPELTVYDYSVSRTTPLVEGVDYFEVTSANYHNNMTVRNDAYAEIKFGVPGSNYSVQSSAVNSPKYRILSRAITGDFTVKLKDPNLNREYIYNEDKGYYYTDAYNYYHGTPVIPEFEVYYKQDYDSEPIRLRYGSDYTLVQDTATYDYAYPGAHTIKVSGYDNYSGELDITYLITGNLADATIDVTDTYYTGEAAQPPVKVYFDDPVAGVVDNNDLEITYSPTDIHNPLVGRVDIKQKDGVVYLGGTNSQAYTLQWDPSVFTLVPDQVAFGYTGKPITPTFKVVTTGGAEIPINQSDIVYSQNGVINEHTNRGKVKAELNLKVGEKTVPLTTYFTIVAGSLDESCITAPTWLAYQGGANVVNARTITVKNKDNVVLTKGKDYDYTLTNAGGPGDCIVTFTTPPDSNYEILGSLTKTINIKPTAPGNLDSVPGSEDGTEVIYWTKVLYADGYEVTVYDGASEYGKYTVNAPTVNKIVTGLDSGKDYSATVKAFVKDASGNKYFSEASSIMFTTDIGKATGTVTPGSTAGTADIIFNPNSGGTSVYIYRSEDNNKYKLVAIYPKSYVKYTDNKLTSGKTYYYKMQEAYYINGSVVKSDLSDAYSVTIK